jgi:membrane-associated phospholipid phosphatase
MSETLRNRRPKLARRSIKMTALESRQKRFTDQERPDRCMVHGRRRGIPRSGNAYDAFPSGHAMHVGAVASAVSWAYPKSAPVAWGLGGLVAATRIVLLAHWTTDVLAGLAMGALVERCLRPLSKSAIRTRTAARPTRAWRHAQPRRIESSRLVVGRS